MRLLWWAAIIVALLVAVAALPLAVWNFTAGDTTAGIQVLISGVLCCVSAYVLHDLRSAPRR